VTPPSHHESLTSLLVDGVNDVVVTDDGRIWRDEAGALTLYGHIDRRALHADLERILARSGLGKQPLHSTTCVHAIGQGSHLLSRI